MSGERSCVQPEVGLAGRECRCGRYLAPSRGPLVDGRIGEGTGVTEGQDRSPQLGCRCKKCPTLYRIFVSLFEPKLT